MLTRMEKVLAVNFGKKCEKFRSLLSKEMDKNIPELPLQCIKKVIDLDVSQVEQLKRLLYKRPYTTTSFTYNLSPYGTLLYKDVILDMLGNVIDIRV